MFLIMLAPVVPLSTTAPLVKTDFLDLHSFSATIPGQPQPLFKDLTFSFSPGKKYALVGPNGCGKSTLVKQVVAAYHEHNKIPFVPPLPLVTEGRVHPPLSNKYRMGYISQSSVSLSDKTLMEEVRAETTNGSIGKSLTALR